MQEGIAILLMLELCCVRARRRCCSTTNIAPCSSSRIDSNAGFSDGEGVGQAVDRIWRKMAEVGRKNVKAALGRGERTRNRREIDEIIDEELL